MLPTINFRRRVVFSFLASLMLLMAAASMAYADSGYPTIWSGLYPGSSSYDNAGCKLCHAADNQNLNPYGKAFCDQSGTIQERIQAVEDVNSDADPTGSSNITEINVSTQPGWTTAAVPTYARGSCQATGNSETAPAGVSGLLDPAAPTTTTTLPPTTTTTTLPPTTTTTLPPTTTTTTLPPTTPTTTLPPTTPTTTTTTTSSTTTTTLPPTTTTTTLPPECTENAQCDDGVFCNGAETCVAGNCQPGMPPCEDGVDCTEDICDETEDICTNMPDDALCDDEELCTTDSCDVVAGCVFTPVECPDGQQCDSTNGECTPLGCTDDADCDDGFFCNGEEPCDTATGDCQPGIPVDCDDGIDCTVETCDEIDDVCVNTPDDLACPDDGLFCTGDVICDPAAGCVGKGDPCPEWITTCNEDTDTCDMVTGKVTICHIPPGNNRNARTLSINSKAIGAHLSHGDIIGPCP